MTKEKVLECIKSQREIKDCFKEEMARLRDNASSSDETEMMLDLLVIQAKTGDEMFERTGVEEYEL